MGDESEYLETTIPQPWQRGSNNGEGAFSNRSLTESNGMKMPEKKPPAVRAPLLDAFSKPHKSGLARRLAGVCSALRGC